MKARTVVTVGAVGAGAFLFWRWQAAKSAGVPFGLAMARPFTSIEKIRAELLAAQAKGRYELGQTFTALSSLPIPGADLFGMFT